MCRTYLLSALIAALMVGGCSERWTYEPEPRGADGAQRSADTPEPTMARADAAAPLPAGASEEGLLAYWPLDAGEGETARDVAGENDGTIHGAYWVRRETGGVDLAFDGADDYVDCGEGAALDVRGPFTLSAWVLPEEVPAGEVGIAGKGWLSYLMSYYSIARAYIYVGSGRNHAQSDVDPGEWVHLAGTFDGEKVRWYRDGELLDTRDSTFDAVPAGGAFYIGAVFGNPEAQKTDEYTVTGHFRGKIAEVKLWGRALADAEVAAEHARGLAGRFAAEILPCPSLAGEGLKTLSNGDLTLTVSPTGEIQLSDARGRYCRVDSRFSAPGEEAIRYYDLGGVVSADDGDAWSATVEQTGEDVCVVTAECPQYALHRTLRLDGRRLRIQDTLTNRESEPVGILYRYQALTPEPLDAPYLGTSGADPVGVATAGGMDVGFAAEDFVSRAHFAPFARGNQIGYNVGHFALDAGRSHTLDWSVYLLEQGAGRFGLFNAVRADWGVNHTIPGPAEFLYGDRILEDGEQALRERFQRKPLSVVLLNPWVDYDAGTMDHILTREELKPLLQNAAKLIKAVSPDTKVIGCIECDWIDLQPEDVPGFEHLPRWTEGGAKTVWMTDPQTQRIRDANLPWLDSAVTNPLGRFKAEIYARQGKPYLALNVLPGPGNYQSQFLMEQARYVVEDVGLDGFYIDQFVPHWIRSYHDWDGYTVDIDVKTGEILRQYVHPAIYGRTTRLALGEYARDRGAMMIANSYARDTDVARLPILRFAETWSHIHCDELPVGSEPAWVEYLGSGLLGTPLGLGLSAKDPAGRQAELFNRGLIAYLRHGAVSWYYAFADVPAEGPGAGEYGPMSHMFPITPVELFPGGLIGRERILTCISRSFSWTHETEPHVLTFDRFGRQIPSRASLRREGEGWVVEVRVDDWNEICIIEPAR